MGGDDFERLEKCNAQWDIWIDQEEYGKIEKLVILGDDYRNILKKAFEHENCTDDESVDKAWYSLFEDSEAFQIKIDGTLTYPKNRNPTPNSIYYKYWARFFFAKFIRAKIQGKGSDCYFRRLDQVIAYLGRYQPQVDRDNEKANKLAILYLLEMAASGEGPDQRSFGERARRILKDYFEEDDFFEFYDLLSRYNIGMGYQHEGQSRKAMREFDYIINKLQKIYNTNFKGLKDTDHEWKKYVDNRMGFILLLLPALLGRAAIQIKLQLAYHTLRTLDQKKWNLWSKIPDKYSEAKRDYLLAEAYRLIGKLDASEECLISSGKFVSPKSNLSPDNYINKLSKVGKYKNIKIRVIDTTAALLLDRLKEAKNKKGPVAEVIYKSRISKRSNLLSIYWENAKFGKTDREGYLCFITEILYFLSKEAVHSNPTVLKAIRKIYENNKNRLLENEYKETKDCRYCEKQGIDLRRLSTKNYDDFCKNLLSFFDIKSQSETDSTIRDKRDFLIRIQDLENERENLEWRKRNIEFVPTWSTVNKDSCWCQHCLPRKDNVWQEFNNILACSPSFVKEKSVPVPDKITNMAIAQTKSNENVEDLHNSYDYEHIMEIWENHFLEHLKARSIHDPEEVSLHFLGLQRWNSTSPAQGRSLGGGYLVYHTDDQGRTDLGIAIDPGFDFIRNLFHAGFSLSDIDLVLLSHAHIDHVRDFESLVTLCLELKKRKEIKKRLHAIMTLGIYRRLAHVIESPGLREFIEPYIVDIDKELDERYIETAFKFETIPGSFKNHGNNLVPIIGDTTSDDNLKISVRPKISYHNDYSEYSDSFGFVLEFQKGNIKYNFGYTGDTSWSRDVIINYEGCDSLLLHIGSLIGIDEDGKRRFSDYSSPDKCWELAKEKNHPYLVGVLHFLTEIYNRVLNSCDKKWPRLILLSEFGEELRGKIRLDLVKRLNRAYDPLRVLPVDVGLDVLLCSSKNIERRKDSYSSGNGRVPNKKAFICNGEFLKVWCVVCNSFVKMEQVDFEAHGHDEALFCVCKTCRKSTPLNVLQERLKSLHEIGRRLRKDDKTKGAPSYQ